LLDSCSKELGIKVIDLKDDFEKYPNQVFFDYDEHLNKEGHKAVANSISRNLKKFGIYSDSRLLHTFLSGDRYPRANNLGKIYFQSMCEGNFELFEADTSFKNIRRLTFNDVDEFHPVPSPTDNVVAFTEGDQNSNRTRVVLMNINTGVREYVLDNNYYSSIPSFSPDGKFIALCYWKFEGQENKISHTNIIIKNIKSEVFKIITDNNYENWRPIFSPDGNNIFFISNKFGNYDIFETNINDGKEIQITNTLYDEWDPFISPDGKKIIYSAKKDGNWDLFELSLINNLVKQLTFTKGNEWDPIYLNNKIIFAGEFGMLGGIFELHLSPAQVK
jgi:Tol biopolymer transport system component